MKAGMKESQKNAVAHKRREIYIVLLSFMANSRYFIINKIKLSFTMIIRNILPYLVILIC